MKECINTWLCVVCLCVRANISNIAKSSNKIFSPPFPKILLLLLLLLNCPASKALYHISAPRAGAGSTGRSPGSARTGCAAGRQSRRTSCCTVTTPTRPSTRTRSVPASSGCWVPTTDSCRAGTSRSGRSSARACAASAGSAGHRWRDEPEISRRRKI